MRGIELLRGLAYHEMTKEERAKLMMEDYESYAAKVPEGHWLQLLEPMAGLPPYRPRWRD